MKLTKQILTAALLTGLAAGTISARADEKDEHKDADKHEHHHDADAKSDAKTDAKAKPYPLDTCIVTDEKLGEHGKPYVFTHESQEIKLCCKDCLKDFKKEPAKYLKKMEGKAKKQKETKYCSSFRIRPPAALREFRWRAHFFRKALDSTLEYWRAPDVDACRLGVDDAHGELRREDSSPGDSRRHCRRSRPCGD